MPHVRAWRYFVSVPFPPNHQLICFLCNHCGFAMVGPRLWKFCGAMATASTIFFCFGFSTWKHPCTIKGLPEHAGEATSDSSSISVVSASSCPFQFVVHVGPPKTGTTSLQFFLSRHAEWFQKEFGVTIASSMSAKSALSIPVTIQDIVGEPIDFLEIPTNPTHLKNTVLSMNAVLGKKHVVISSEAFYFLTRKGWNYFRSQFGKHADCLSIVVAHRQQLNFSCRWVESDEQSNGKTP